MSATAPDLVESGWPADLPLGAFRFARRSNHFEDAVHFYRDLVGLPVYASFVASFGSDGMIFRMPNTGCTFEIVRATEPVPVDSAEQLCLYFDGAEARDRACARLLEAGVQPVPQHPYWEAQGALTFNDPDGREVVFAPWVFGQQARPVDH